MTVQIDRERSLAVDRDRLQLDPIDQRAQDVGGLGAIVGMVQSIA